MFYEDSFPVFTHPGQPQMQAQVIAKSASENAPNLTTIRLRYPRFIHAEFMTHRDFSRNARSSRAVPIKKMIHEIRETPAVPWHWGKNQKGMQASEECNEIVYCQKALMPMDGYSYGHSSDWDGTEVSKTGIPREDAWLVIAKRAADMAEAFMEAGYHKQIVNRLLEPFMWIDVLVTSCKWENFFWLRNDDAAEPHIRDLSVLMEKAINAADAELLMQNEWHLPYITEADSYAALNAKEDFFYFPEQFLLMISAARCARISYVPFDGDASYERELERYDMLVKSNRIHASPMEHQATPDTFKHTRDTPFGHWQSAYLHGNLEGWIQYRKLIRNEVVRTTA